jgi:hypothetical protein
MATCAEIRGRVELLWRCSGCARHGETVLVNVTIELPLRVRCDVCRCEPITLAVLVLGATIRPIHDRASTRTAAHRIRRPGAITR